jgi:hypothetical protein
MAQLSDVRNRQQQAGSSARSWPAGLVCWSVMWLSGAVGPAQPDQAVHTTAGVAVQAPVSGEAALVGGTHPMTAGELAMRADRQGDRA